MKAVHAEALAAVILTTSVMDSARVVLLARARICQEPDIIILDEPTSFLDIKHKLDLFYLFFGDSMKKKQITVIMSLHEIDLAQKIDKHHLCKGDTISHFGKT